MSTLATRFWAKVSHRPHDGCWEWSASTKASGHGQLHHKGRTIYAHRLSYELNVGEIPADMVVRHTCDNPLCVRPDHLVLGSQADNIRDMIDRGRARYVGMPGERNPNAKLTDQERADICVSDLGPKALSEKYGVSPQTIWLVRRTGKLVEAA